MPNSIRLAYFAHTLRSDWNNGNAHFLRGLLRALTRLGHRVTAFETESGWSIDNLRTEPKGESSLLQFCDVYSDLDVQTYAPEDSEELWKQRLRGIELVILHEWNPPVLAHMLLKLRDQLGYKLLFHDTHHRASSSPKQMELLAVHRFDGILAFGESLRRTYQEHFGVQKVWTFHEAADTTVFKPLPEIGRSNEIIWVGNWGEGERSGEICTFLLEPAWDLRDVASATIYGVRYPEEGLSALRHSGVKYGGYLPNLEAPLVYAKAAATVHVPRQQYSKVIRGIPTIRVFEALACGVPLVSAPWDDSERLFRDGDLLWAENTAEMTKTLRLLTSDRGFAEEQTCRGLETILARHTCLHRAVELTAIYEEILG